MTIVGFIFCDGVTPFGEACSLLFLSFSLSIILFFILSFLHLPVRPVGCNLRSPSVAREAQLLVTVGRGGVRSVGIFKAKLRKVI